MCDASSSQSLLCVAFLAFLFDRLFGYPRILQAGIGHPVQWMGWVIARLEPLLNRPRSKTARMRGFLMMFLLALSAVLPALACVAFFYRMPGGWAIEALLASPFLAQKSLQVHLLAVSEGLRLSPDAGRKAVSHIVGRDVDALNEQEIEAAAIESLAENTSDGVVAPFFFLLIGGLPAIVLYKAINTADSMVGYKTPAYQMFGWTAARLDDLVNFIPARVTACLFIITSLFVCGLSGRIAWRMVRRDARRHASPNAGYPEAAMAGALGVRLEGGSFYDGRKVDSPTLGEGRAVRSGDIERALLLYRRTLDLILSATAVTMLSTVCF